MHMNKQVKLGMFYKSEGAGDKFLKSIIENLPDRYDIKRFAISNYNLEQLVQGMNWADLCWFEWCSDLFALASRLEIAKNKIVFCRLHRGEVFTTIPATVDWKNVDGLIVVTNHLLHLLPKNIPKNVNISVIENGVDIRKFDFRSRTKGYNIAFVAGMIPRKNPVLLLQIVEKLVKLDRRYKLFIAGEFINPEIKFYWDYFVKERGLHNNVIFEGWQGDINEWLEDKNYILSTSIHESFGYNIAEAMIKGIKPIIYNFPYSKEIWDEKYLFNTVDEAVIKITEDQYDSLEYYNFIKNRYSLEKEIKLLDEFLLDLLNKSVKNQSEKTVRTKACTGNNIVIFGASALGKAAYEIYKGKADVRFFCDNDKNKWGTKINGIEVVSPDLLTTLEMNFDVIIASMYYEEIRKQLINMGIDRYKIFFVNTL